MSGRLIAILIVVCAAAAGGAMYWLQVYAFYRELAPGEVSILITRDGTAAPAKVSGLRAITADSSPIRFRACFNVDDPGTVVAMADEAKDAVPLNAPGWFDCFDAARIGADLAAGRAAALMGEANIRFGIDRVLAVYPDGQAFAWHRINACGREVFDGNPLPAGCPAPPGPDT